MANHNSSRRGVHELAPEASLGAFIRTIIHDEMSAALDEKLPRHLEALRLPARGAELVESGWVNRKRAKEITGWSLRTIGRRIADGELAASGPRRDRIKRSDIDRMMAHRKGRIAAVSDEDEIAREADRLFGDK